ncbi:hypothetical protein C8J57DRAFT_1301904 [Mycena rebaudengoi]|nr:hypothetical protein C8J57DRAFT_1301904 [Mycena rebaudengoi]
MAFPDRNYVNGAYPDHTAVFSDATTIPEPMTRTTTLLSLPNELLVLIFENLQFPVDYLCTLAMLNRRVHILALSIYFARNNMPSPSKSVVIRMRLDGMDTLTALQMALCICLSPKIEHLECILPHPSCVSVIPLLPHLSRLRRFISRLSLDRVILQLDVGNSKCNATGDDYALRAWSSTFEALLNSFVQTSCTDFTIRAGTYFTRSYAISKTPRWSAHFIRTLEAFFSSKTDITSSDVKFQRVPQQGLGRNITPMSLDARSRHCTVLNVIHIQSVVLLTPPGLRWTLSALQHSPVTTLSISEVSMDTQLWRAAFYLIAKATPGLTDLSLSELECISDIEILAFCSRLPRLTRLKIGRNELNPDTPTRCEHGAPIPEFRNLASIHAPSDFLLYFLRPRLCFPNLKSLSIAFHYLTDIRNIGATLPLVCRAMAARKVSASISLSLALSSATIASDLDSVSELHSEVTQYFRYVARLDLLLHTYDMAGIARWIGIFSSVQHVSIVRNKLPTDIDAEASRLIQAVTENKSFLRTMTIHGKNYAVSGDTLPRLTTQSGPRHLL